MIFLILLISINILLMNNRSQNPNYKYNDNGRIIIPSNEIISRLPEDGGELWNRLIFESSPYLLQHAANPVDWYPWSDKAFNLAKKLNKPVFLSIGYTTCHWCHVMEHESFEDNEVASKMNDTFINVKVDREERPDIDNVYMEITQDLTGRGGWPMTVIMTPDKEPFFAGTYFPKNSIPNYNRIGMNELIPKIDELWKTKNDSLVANAKKIVSVLKDKHNTSDNFKTELKNNILESSFNVLNKRFDRTYGGFTGSRNKFPKPHDYSFLIRYYYRTKNKDALNIVSKSLYEMKKGGIYDQIGFGFHRYSTDKKWLVPHFEKMLYDQAMLIHAYLDAFLITNDNFYKDTVDEICEYVLRDMTSNEGGFYSAEDADSQGEEGVFYIWDIEDFQKKLTKEEFDFIAPILNIKSDGNSFVEGLKTNIPYMTFTLEELYSISDLNKNDFYNNYHRIRKKIFNYRENRVRPQKDDKILTDWNGLMISALARASIILNNDSYLFSAKRSADFIIKYLMDDNGKLLKRYRNGSYDIDGMIEDYAFFIWGLIELYQADFDDRYIEIASTLADYQINHFWDFENKGFYFTSNLSESLIVRSKEIYDGAIPSGNSVSSYNFIRLSRILSRSDYEQIAISITNAFSENINKYGHGSTMLLQAIDYIKGPSFEVIVSGDKNKSLELIRQIQKHKNFNKIIIYNNTDNKIFKFLEFYKSGDNGSPLVYVCENYSCKLPTNDIEQINKLLE